MTSRSPAASAAGLVRQPPPELRRDVGIAVNPALATRIRDADVLLVIGERLGEMTTSGYTLLRRRCRRRR